MALDLEWLSGVYKSFGHNSQISPDHNGVITAHNIGDRTVQIKTVISLGRFPEEHPMYILIGAKEYAQLAHVSVSSDGNGIVCIGQQTEFHLDYEDPASIVKDGLYKAITTLSRALTSPEWNESELIREFADHWSHICDTKERVTLVAEPAEYPVPLTSFKVNEKADGYLHGSRLLVAKESPLNKLHVVYDKLKGRQVQGKGILITLEEVVSPPRSNSHLSDWWSRLLELQSEQLKGRLSEASRHHKSNVFYLTCYAIHNDHQVWFTLRVESADKQYAPLRLGRLEGWEFTAVQTESPINTTSLLPRGGASSALQSRKVCIIGCGSVGGYIVDQLASSGIGHITTIDFDNLEIDNIHRHFLNAYYLGMKKSKALALALMTKYPFVQVTAEQGKLEKFIEEKRFTEFDLVILATGNVTLERRANEQLYKTVDPPPLLATWVEAYGVGGHASITVPGADGCLSCIYTDADTGELDLYPSLSFIERDQLIRTSHAGCGSDYIAYSNSDAIQTATIATRLALRALNGNLIQGVSMSWKGEMDLAMQYGIALTERYASETYNMQEIPLYVRGCNVCN